MVRNRKCDMTEHILKTKKQKLENNVFTDRSLFESKVLFVRRLASKKTVMEFMIFFKGLGVTRVNIDDVVSIEFDTIESAQLAFCLKHKTFWERDVIYLSFESLFSIKNQDQGVHSVQAQI